MAKIQIFFSYTQHENLIRSYKTLSNGRLQIKTTRKDRFIFRTIYWDTFAFSTCDPPSDIHKQILKIQTASRRFSQMKGDTINSRRNIIHTTPCATPFYSGAFFGDDFFFLIFCRRGNSIQWKSENDICSSRMKYEISRNVLIRIESSGAQWGRAISVVTHGSVFVWICARKNTFFYIEKLWKWALTFVGSLWK